MSSRLHLRDSEGEVRRAVRLPVDLPARWVRDGKHRPGRTVDLAPDSLFVECEAPPPLGAELSIELDHDGEVRTLRVRVIRLGVARRRVRHPGVQHLTLAAHGFAAGVLGETPAWLSSLYEEALLLDEG